MQQHNLLAQRKADATAVLPRGKKRDKNMFQQVGRNAFAVVMHLDINPLIFLRSAEADVGKLYLAYRLNGVHQQVNHHLLDQFDIEVELQLGIFEDDVEGFAYRIEISWWIFAAAGLAAVSIALLTVSWQAIRAALANPVESLRDE